MNNEGNQNDSEYDEECLVKYYFTRGFQYDAIVDFLSKRHGLHTQQKTHNLFWPDENSIEQCFAAHIVQGC